MMSDTANSLKLQGNEAFKNSDYSHAKYCYSEALKEFKSLDDSALTTLLTNRAACDLKLSLFDSCIEDCSKVLEINALSVKALYRRAVAYEAKGDYRKSVADLGILLRYDAKNNDAIALMRKVKSLLLEEQSKSSPIKLIMDSAMKDDKQVIHGLKSITALVYEDKNHAMDFVRKGGLQWMVELINGELDSHTSNSATDTTDSKLLHAIRLISACSNHVNFVRNHIDVNMNDGLFVNKRFQKMTVNMVSTDKINFVSLCSLLSHNDSAVVQVLVVLIMTILKAIPASAELSNIKDKKSINSNSDDTQNDVPTVDSQIVFTLDKAVTCAVLCGFYTALSSRFEDIYSIITDSLCAFLSDSADYFERGAEVDTRMENLSQRKRRLRDQYILKKRSTNHATWAVECGLLALLCEHVDCEQVTVRHNAGNALGKLIHFVDNEVDSKKWLEPYLQGYADQQEQLLDESKRVVELHDALPLTVPQCRRRAAIEAVLLMSKPELGSWALALPGGVSQLLFLVATNDLRCQELAAEVMCLAASSDASSGQLTSIVSSGVLTTLLHSPSQGTRTAAASTITKLSLKAKALNEDSSEIAAILNAVLEVLKTANQLSSAVDTTSATPNSSDSKKKASSSESRKLVSFSSMDEVGSSQLALAKKQSVDNEKKKKDLTNNIHSAFHSQQTSAVTMTSVERAIEVLAALIGKTCIKEEIVHGSFRVSACLPELVKLDLDIRSTAAYGLTHILAALTVTNAELHAKALADKDISPEQYQQMQELQRIKTKDDDGNIIEEKKDEGDSDTPELCRRRIQRLVACNGITALVKYLTSGSAQTKETAARTLRQICVDEGSRGLVLQQGAFKACCNTAIAEDTQKQTRMESAHAVAKTLVTTNPNLLTEHMRLGAIKPLLFLCRETDSSNLQQFESLLALTNVLSCGITEQDRFVAEKGVHAVHYLIFSDNVMVRRAAVEALCNMSTHEAILKLLRTGDNIKLWLGLSEDWENETHDAHEAFLIARAAAGTLAGAASDLEIADIMCKHDCVRTVVALMESKHTELMHRALVIILELLSSQKRSVAEHLMTGNVIPAIGLVSNVEEPILRDLALNCAQLLSSILNSPESSSNVTIH